MTAAELQIRPEDRVRATSSARRLQAQGYNNDVAGLTMALQADAVSIRAEAAFLLGYAHEPAAREALQQRLGDASARVRAEAALALARLGDLDIAIPVLHTELRGEFFEDAPLRAGRALAILGDPAGYGRAMEALVSPFPSNRMEAIAVIPTFLPYTGQVVEGRTVDSVAALVQATIDPDPLLRRDALSALTQTEDPRSIPVLEASARDPDPGVRKLSQRLLEQSPVRAKLRTTPEGAGAASTGFGFAKFGQRNPCAGCPAPCCRLQLLPYKTPQTFMDMDHMRYMLLFPRTEMVVSRNGDWSVVKWENCRELEHGTCTCKLHDTVAKPQTCAAFNGYNCWYKRNFVTERPPEIYRLDKARFDVWVGEIHFDEQGQIVRVPGFEVSQEILSDIPIEPMFQPLADTSLGQDIRLVAARAEPMARNGIVPSFAHREVAMARHHKGEEEKGLGPS